MKLHKAGLDQQEVKASVQMEDITIKKKSVILKVVFDAVRFKKIVQCTEHSK